ncbi:hypothetical protein VTN96DRAFT_8477 [Rasamsonia emersonii]
MLSQGQRFGRTEFPVWAWFIDGSIAMHGQILMQVCRACMKYGVQSIISPFLRDVAALTPPRTSTKGPWLQDPHAAECTNAFWQEQCSLTGCWTLAPRATQQQ